MIVKDTEKIVAQDIINILRKEWYDLNNIETQPNDTPRDIGIRVGAKSETLKLINKIKKRYGLE